MAEEEDTTQAENSCPELMSFGEDILQVEAVNTVSQHLRLLLKEES